MHQYRGEDLFYRIGGVGGLMSILQSLDFCDGESELPHLMLLTASLRYLVTTFYMVYLKMMIRCILSSSCIKEIAR